MSELTREQILAMPAGRELDALVAQHVMGYNEHNFEFDEELQESYRLEFNESVQDDVWEPFEPSQKIAAAWEVVEKLSDKDFTIFKGDDHCEVSIGSRKAITGKNVPELLCKTSLLAVMRL